MLKELAELFRYRELLLNLVIRDIKVRYKNSALGFLWSLINPLVQVFTMYIIFQYVIGFDIPNYSAYLLCAFLPWTFFQMSVLDASMSVLFHGNLVKKTYFPREILPISIVLSNLVHFLMAMIVFFAWLIFKVHAPIHITWILVPAVIVIQLLLNLGVAFFVSALNVFYEDIKYLMTVVLNLAFYIVPIFYLVEQISSSKLIPAAYKPLVLKFYFLNPLSMLITAYRKLILDPYNVPGIRDIPLNYGYLALAGLTSLLIFLAGYAFFNSKKWTFAERL